MEVAQTMCSRLRKQAEIRIMLTTEETISQFLDYVSGENGLALYCVFGPRRQSRGVLQTVRALVLQSEDYRNTYFTGYITFKGN